ncbi:MAG TPA: hypothetical protein VKA31_06910 [Mariprofundaceae bacterium]|nr:hypothetical protein [Mariprofundaceae bacterium]
MSIVRSHPTTHFLNLPNALAQDFALSWEARGLLVYILSLPENWETYITELSNRSPAGYAKNKRIITELEAAGYIVRSQIRGKKGRFVGWEWDAYDAPQPITDGGILPHSDNPHSEGPDAAESKLQRTHKKKNPQEKEPTLPEGGKGLSAKGMLALRAVAKAGDVDRILRRISSIGDDDQRDLLAIEAAAGVSLGKVSDGVAFLMGGKAFQSAVDGTLSAGWSRMVEDSAAAAVRQKENEARKRQEEVARAADAAERDAQVRERAIEILNELDPREIERRLASINPLVVKAMAGNFDVSKAAQLLSYHDLFESH